MAENIQEIIKVKIGKNTYHTYLDDKDKIKDVEKNAEIEQLKKELKAELKQEIKAELKAEMEAEKNVPQWRITTTNTDADTEIQWGTKNG